MLYKNRGSDMVKSSVGVSYHHLLHHQSHHSLEIVGFSPSEKYENRLYDNS